MEAMQIRVSRETPRAARYPRRSIVHLVALAIAATMWLGAHPAFADSVSPPGDDFTATSTRVKFVVGLVTVTCTSSSTSGTVPASGVCGPITTPTFSGCKTNLGSSATVLASGAWRLCVANHGGNPTSTLTIPQRGVSASATVLSSTCTVTAAPNGPANVTGQFTNGTSATPTANPASKVTYTAVSVPVSAGGGFGCPTSSTSTLTATYTVRDTTNPSAAITVGP